MSRNSSAAVCFQQYTTMPIWTSTITYIPQHCIDHFCHKQLSFGRWMVVGKTNDFDTVITSQRLIEESSHCIMLLSDRTSHMYLHCSVVVLCNVSYSTFIPSTLIKEAGRPATPHVCLLMGPTYYLSIKTIQANTYNDDDTHRKSIVRPHPSSGYDPILIASSSLGILPFNH